MADKAKIAREPDSKIAKRGRMRTRARNPTTAERRARETPEQRRARIALRREQLRKRAQAIELGRGPPLRIVMTGKGGGRLTLLSTPFDGDDEFSQVWKARYSELISHLGGEPTLPQKRIADHAARLSLIADVGWTAVKRDGVLNRKKQPTGAFEAYAKAVRGELELLKLIGLERRSKHVPTIAEVLAQGPSTIEQPPTPGVDGADADANAEEDGSE